ncbi:hypothetical protein PQX77_006836 [Marasmius sp. AFHP31]|nr:hypothetical protein PQX77_006836 [Marasmius sp. AFHP31]
MAAWRNGIASDYDLVDYQEIAGSTPAVVNNGYSSAGEPDLVGRGGLLPFASGTTENLTSAGQYVGISTKPGGSLAKTAAESKAIDKVISCAVLGNQLRFPASRFRHAEKLEEHIWETLGALVHQGSCLPHETDTLTKFATWGNKAKTTSDDDLEAFTATQVKAIHVDTVKSVFELKNATTLPKSSTAVMSVSVASPRGGSLCIGLQSVFPGSLKAATRTPRLGRLVLLKQRLEMSRRLLSPKVPASAL